jgi:hypothetical protein
MSWTLLDSAACAAQVQSWKTKSGQILQQFRGIVLQGLSTMPALIRFPSAFIIPTSLQGDFH